ncbi:MAG: sialidase family protein, partial [Actinomycetes bacterium]
FTPGDEPDRGYRIPAMLVLPGDQVLAFAESRQDAMSDLLDINIVERRSGDGGRTWTPIQTVQDEGSHTVHSPTPVFDATTGTVWLPYCVDYERLYLTSSVDRGVTWTPQRDLSAELGLAAGTYCHNGPGNGIQLPGGRLVIPTNQGAPRTLISDDHGVTWRLGESMGAGEEPAVFAKVDGTVCANLRNAAGAPRIVTCSPDGGLSWLPWRLDEHLTDAGTQASIMRYSGVGGGQPSRLLFSNPGAWYRGEETLRLSYDDGSTWPVARMLYDGASGYSQIGVLGDGTVLVLFEAGRNELRESITLARVDLDWLTQGSAVPVRPTVVP